MEVAVRGVEPLDYFAATLAAVGRGGAGVVRTALEAASWFSFFFFSGCFCVGQKLDKFCFLFF